ncbi:HTTM domain-containing protein, partial [bacterium]
THSYRPKLKTFTIVAILIFTLAQVTIPLRFLFYDGNLFWKEEGYRFSWRVMLMEKTGATYFTVLDKDTGKKIEIVNSDYLTKNQEIQMSTQPDLILQFVQFIKKDFANRGKTNIAIFSNSFVKLNGNYSKRFIDENVDLAKLTYNDDLSKWIRPFKN